MAALALLVACGERSALDQGTHVDAASPSDAGPGVRDADSIVSAVSCVALHQAQPSLPTGVYMATYGGQPLPTYCEMSVAGGGFTAFFADGIGYDRTIGHFESTTDACPDPAARCIRRLPFGLPAGTTFMASCGGAFVTFQLSDAAVGYFTSGAQAGWQRLASVTAASGTPNLATTLKVWTGEGGNQGWIISADDRNPLSTPLTFASSYDFNANWDYCNGVQTSGTIERLFFR